MWQDALRLAGPLDDVAERRELVPATMIPAEPEDACRDRFWNCSGLDDVVSSPCSALRGDLKARAVGKRHHLHGE
jgi:hypothetical protein